MGYESRFYIVEKSDLNVSTEFGLKWAELIASFDLSKVYSISEPIRAKYPDTDSFFYLEDKAIVEDMYGAPLKEVPITDLIDMIKHEIRTYDHYRRYQPFLALLQGFDLSEWRNLVVLHYGH